jgi:hypothetical protein
VLTGSVNTSASVARRERGSVLEALTSARMSVGGRWILVVEPGVVPLQRAPGALEAVAGLCARRMGFWSMGGGWSGETARSAARSRTALAEPAS